MEMKAPATTAQPQPPSGGSQPTGPLGAGGMAAAEEEEWRRRTEVRTQNLGRKQRERAGVRTDITHISHSDL